MNTALKGSNTVISMLPPPFVLTLIVPPLLVNPANAVALPANPNVNHVLEFSVPPVMLAVPCMTEVLLLPLEKEMMFAERVPPLMFNLLMPEDWLYWLPPTCASPEMITVPLSILTVDVGAPLAP